ncbi:hypothetical protein GCM10007939_06360 [Amylibacter marinus]|uniref:Ribonuclease E n=1 Tax=Amylibacter marinus TaxID=1475483 RepID=A0ABQ5VSZ3_9RHOB|nr:Rne/Rng family ribonuclease [Amylibacter marinus]GLQ34353.1 hypothetical protein GCM10007939_06360 [Amylibacter marinus]
MSKKMLIDATHAEETRVVVVDGNKVDEFDFESLNKRQLAGNIYLAKVTRVEPSLQAAFIDYGGNRHGFLAFAEIHPDYYQIPVADREKLLEEEEAYAKAIAEEAEKAAKAKPRKSRSRRRKSNTAAAAAAEDAIVTSEVIEVAESDSGLVDVPEASDVDAPVESAVSSEEQSAPAEADAPIEAEAKADTPIEESAPAEVSEPATTQEVIEAEESEDEDDSDEDAQIDDGIESVADEDVEEEVRPRKPRPRRYKIQEVIKVRQILLVQVVKEERGNKGAALTTYLSLAGRYCVLMPNTARGGGISRKITNAQDRKKIKDITSKLEVAKGAGLIVRTAGAKRSKDDIIRDYEYLTRQWEQIRDLTLESIAPAQIYAEGDLIKRSIRDLYNSDIDEIIVEGERGFEAAQAYMTMLMPTHLNRVKQYTDRMPLYARFQVENYLGGMFNPTVQLKSGGYIVIGVTEALVAIDVNSGKATKESSIEKTALKTNLEAAEEVARQLRLRDLAGLIVIDFIDMEERRNNTAVEKRMKDKLKNDRARIQVGRISGFGLMEMSRQRLRPGMLEATTKECPHCLGTGLVRSDDSQALSILREIEEEAVRKRTKEVAVTVPVAIANYLLNHKRDNIGLIETQYGLSIVIEASPAMIGTEYQLEKRKTSSRIVADPIEIPTAFVVESDVASEPNPTPTNESDEDKPKKRRRRRRRRGRKDDANTQNPEQSTEQVDQADTPPAPEQSDTPNAAEDTVVEPVKPADETPEPEVKTPRKRGRPRKKAVAAVETATDAETPPAEASTEEPAAVEPVAEVAEKPAPKKRAPRKRKPKASEEATVAEDNAATATTAEDQAPEAEEKPKRKRGRPRKVVAEDAAEPASEEAAAKPASEEAAAKPAPKKRAPRKKAAAKPKVEKTVAEKPTPEVAPAAEITPEPVPEPVVPAPAQAETAVLEQPAPEEPKAKPKRRGWWSRS